MRCLGRGRRGEPNLRLVRYADDFLVLVAGTRDHCEVLREEVAAVLAPMGMRLSMEKTTITHIDEGLDFLGRRIQPHRKVKIACRMDVNQPLPNLLRQLNLMLRGWCAYFRPGVSSATFQYLHNIVWHQVWKWIRRKRRRTHWKELSRRYHVRRGWPAAEEITLFGPEKVRTTRYRCRGAVIPSPWPATG
ncbi:group II intron maturase-specific domain-containing protein [Streptomyces sp. DG2A-72]|uniref:group II intron maturase-specific domain-containing protein n=1 Tax=Streptomyces sp. DG2A-72 TaxID=3051386 RepID=UPI00265C18C3|nr:group II intron maturase-specific domain-containing protein [Streptomyces sp. DG2A-72]MDO0930478.1 group II intron maturase-specific domain-containing protein [Streptomyces sp. DG2A-72]